MRTATEKYGASLGKMKSVLISFIAIMVPRVDTNVKARHSIFKYQLKYVLEKMKVLEFLLVLHWASRGQCESFVQESGFTLDQVSLGFLSYTLWCSFGSASFASEWHTVRYNQILFGNRTSQRWSYSSVVHHLLTMYKGMDLISSTIH